MKILFLLRFFPIYGGGESVTLKLANKFVEIGYDVGIFYLWETKNTVNEFIDARIKSFRSSNEIEILNLTDYSKNDIPKISKQIENTIETFKPNILINQWFPADLIYHSNKIGAKIITCLHTIVYDPVRITTRFHKIINTLFGEKVLQKLQNFRRKQILFNNYKYSDYYVVLSDYLRDDLNKLLGLKNSKKIISISNPVRYDKWIDNSEIDKKENCLLFVGRFSKEKRIEEIINIWQKIDVKIKSNWNLVLCGDGPEFNNIKNIINAVDDKSIKLLGYSNPFEYYRKSKILILTSSYEGLPMVIPEAMQNGCVPVVYDSFRTLHDLVSSGEDGLIVENNNTGEFVEKLESLMTDDLFYKRLLIAGILKSKNYSLQIIINQWKNLFSLALENKKL